MTFVGTDHVFRLNGTRVEAFSGLARSLFRHLRDGGSGTGERRTPYVARSGPLVRRVRSG